jgi:mannose-6-phosphate isomerase
VQVHPDDRQAALQDPPDLGKTEAWVVLAAESQSAIYAGLKRGFDRSALERKVSRGTVELCLHRIEPQVGDCIYVPAGTLHALGKGLLVAEIQQASDTTFRLFDWNRMGASGQLRELHVEQALGAIDYGRGPVERQKPRPTERRQVERLVDGDKFVLDRWTFDSPLPTPDAPRFHVLAVLAGRLDVENDPTGQSVVAGEVVLIPASLGGVLLTPAEPCVLLDMYLP